MRTAVLDSSIDAYQRLPVKTLATQSDRIHEVIAQALRDGHEDMSLQEIKAAYFARWGTRIDLSSVSARVNAMVGTRLDRMETTRACTVSGKTVHPVRIPLVQKGLFS